ncbi:MAG: hypothetical protein KGH71_02865 [Candidatus Micrarchaeota archaeon]|nr:hypothetical protein [Candidatus Micrarchaeota archaeon]
MYKAQLSFEFMVYISLAGLSLLSSLSMLNVFSGAIRGAFYHYELSDLVSKANLAATTGIPSNLSLLTPQILCNAIVVDNVLMTNYGNFSLASGANLSGSFCVGKNQTLLNGLIS